MQYQAGRQVHERLFGAAPEGAWIPECAYRPAGEYAEGFDGPLIFREGLEQTLAKHGIRYTFVDSHMIEGGVLAWSTSSDFRQRSVEGDGQVPDDTPGSLYRPHWVGDGRFPVSVFARDPCTGVQVWSGEIGFPGAGCYLEFHKRHDPSGHRYWRVTSPNSDLGDKEVYDATAVTARVESQAQQFVEMVEGLIHRYDGEGMPVITAPYDAELFGHWWFEGPQWLQRTLELLDASSVVQPTTPKITLQQDPPSDRMLLPEGSWGEQGDHRTWGGPHSEGFWRRIERGQRRLLAMVQQAPQDDLDERLQRQAARTLLLLQASDWPFLIYTKAAEDYAERRIELHFLDLESLLDAWNRRRRRPHETHQRDVALLQALESRDAVFPDIDLSVLVPGGSVAQRP